MNDSVGVKISTEGKEVDSRFYQDFTFRSSDPVIKVRLNSPESHYGIVEHQVISTSLPYGTILLKRINHNLGYKPAIILKYEFTGAGFYSGFSDGYLPFAPSNFAPGHAWEYYVDKTKLDLQFRVIDYTAQGITQKNISGTKMIIKYFILSNQVGN